jgi:hypothetical protein
VVDPAKDFVRGSNFDVFCLSRGMTVSDADGHGVGLCPIDAPLVSLGYPGIYRYAKEFTPREPVAFINLFNNAWGTNFQQWIGGSWQSRVRLWATGERGLEAELVTPGSEARSPAQAVLVDAQNREYEPAPICANDPFNRTVHAVAGWVRIPAEGGLPLTRVIGRSRVRKRMKCPMRRERTRFDWACPRQKVLRPSAAAAICLLFPGAAAAMAGVVAILAGVIERKYGRGERKSDDGRS